MSKTKEKGLTDIFSLSELKETIENACGVPIENQVLMTSLGIQVRDTNLTQVIQSQGSVGFVHNDYRISMLKSLFFFFL